MADSERKVCFEKRCSGTMPKTGKPCQVLFGTYTALDGEEVIVCHKCKTRNIFKHQLIQGIQITNGRRPQKRLAD